MKHYHLKTRQILLILFYFFFFVINFICEKQVEQCDLIATLSDENCCVFFFLLQIANCKLQIHRELHTHTRNEY